MNISVSFNADKLPVAYRLALLSLIKECVRKGDAEAYRIFFEHQGPKPYVYSVFLNRFTLAEDEFHVSGFRLNLSCADYSFVIPFLNGLQKTRHFQYKQYSFQRKAIEYGQENRVTHPRILIRTLSPILVEDANHRPMSPYDNTYNDELNYIMNRISLTLREHPLRQPIRLTPVSVKKSVIRESNESFQKAKDDQKTNSAYLYFTAYAGRFVLEGAPEDLSWMLKTGVGFRSSQGLGHCKMESEVNS